VKRLKLAVVLALASLSLSGCTMAPSIYLLNNSGLTVELLRAEGDGDRSTSERIGGWFFGRAWIGNQAGRHVMWRRPDLPAQIELQIGRCTYWYALPALTTDWNHSAVMQVEPRLALYLIADDIADPSDVLSKPVDAFPAQPEGFPVEPSITCPEPAS
jgi:hypothetical protein